VADAVEQLKHVLARWMDDPDGEHPYLLTLERYGTYRATEEEWLDEDVELDLAAGTASLLGLDTHGRGREEFFRVWRSWLEVWGEYRMGFSNWEQRGDSVIVDLEVEASGKLSGAPAKLAVTQIWTLRQGRIASLRVFGSRHAAVADLEGASR